MTSVTVMVRVLSVVSALLFVSMCVGDDSTEHVLNYDGEKLKTALKESHHFVMFFAPWCGHCKRLKPTWDQLAEKYNQPEGKAPHDVKVAKVDCTVETAACAAEDVTGYPTLKFFKVGGDPVKYRGSRDLESIEKFIKEQLEEGKKEPAGEEKTEDTPPVPTNGLIELTEQSFRTFTEQGQHFIKFYAPWCGHCQRLAPIWEALAKSFEYDKNVNIGKLDCTQHRTVCAEMEVKGYPTLLWVKDGKRVEKYQGARTHDDLKNFISKMMATEDEHRHSEEEKIPDLGKPPVKILTKETFTSEISTGLTFVKFFAPWCGHCKRLAPIWEQLGKKFEGNAQVTIAKVDCTAENEQSICDEQKVDGFPTMLLFRDGKQIASYEDDRKLTKLQSFVMKHLSETKDEL